jgi:hypothetical protein
MSGLLTALFELQNFFSWRKALQRMLQKHRSLKARFATL